MHDNHPERTCFAIIPLYVLAEQRTHLAYAFGRGEEVCPFSLLFCVSSHCSFKPNKETLNAIPNGEDYSEWPISFLQ